MKGRKVPLDKDPLNLVWLHLAHGRRPAHAAGVRVLPALDLRSDRAGELRVASTVDSPRMAPARN